MDVVLRVLRPFVVVPLSHLGQNTCYVHFQLHGLFGLIRSWYVRGEWLLRRRLHTRRSFRIGFRRDDCAGKTTLICS